MIRVSLSFALFLACLSGAFAATARAEGATLFVNEMSVLTLRTAVGKTTAAQRTAVLAGRLSKLVSLGALTLAGDKDGHRIMVGADILVLISKEEAKRHGSSPAALATKWSNALLSAWAQPPVQLAKEEVMLPPGGTARVAMVGSAVRTAPLVNTDPSVSTPARKGAVLTIRALAVGSSTITIGTGLDARSLTVKVQPYAATLPQTLQVAVVGAPALAATVKGAVEGAIQTGLQTQPGAKYVITSMLATDVATGQKRTMPVKIRVSAPDTYQVEGTVNVAVSNRAMALRKESALWYCNEPENVKRPMALFQADLEADQAARMLYHHINDSSSALYFRVLARNESELPAQIVIIPGDSKPDKNPVLAGIQAADPFFRAWLVGSGEVVTIPPGTALPIAFRRLAPLDTSSGLCYLRLLPGGPAKLSVVAEALDPLSIDARLSALMQSPTPWREVPAMVELSPVHLAVASPLIFPQPFKEETFTHQVGGRFSFFRIGQRPIARADLGKPLEGNFGVIYNIQAKAENLTSAPADLELVFETSAGYSGALFTLDGQFIRLPLMQPKAEARLARFRLEPGQSRTFNLSTIPLSGSSYPATLVLRPVSNMRDIGTQN